MKRRAVLRLSVVCAISALALFIIIGIILAGRDMPPLAPQSQPILIPGGRVANHHVSVKSWSFDYDHAQLSPDGSYGTIDGLHNGIIYRHGKPFLKISAQHATLNTITYDFTATGRVRVQRIGTTNSQMFETDFIVWENSVKQLKLNHPSYVRTGNQLLKIEHVLFDVKNGTLRVGTIDGAVAL
jgi:hypothetical protein